MEEMKINLEEIMRNSIIHHLLIKNMNPKQVLGISDKIINDDWYVKNAMLEFGKQLLKLANENAFIQDWYEDGKLVSKRINERSILDTINQVG